MKDAAFESKSLFASAQLFKISGSFWNSGAIQSHFDSTGWFTVNGNVKKDGVRYFGFFFANYSLKETANHVKIR